ncbi:MAG TPA: glycosyltransferase family 4 protein [Actinomycetes bacterium]
MDDNGTAIALHVCTRYQRGGSERRIRDVVAALPELRHHLLLGAESDVELARAQTSAERVSVLPTLLRHVSAKHDLAALRHLRRVLRQDRYDVVVTHQSKAGALGRLAALGGGPPVVHSLSMASFGPGYSRVESTVFRALERLLAHRTAAFCVVGADLAARFEKVGVPGGKLHVVRSGVPLPSRVTPREEARRVVGERYGIAPERRLLCYVGSLEARKNVLLLPEVLSQLCSGLSAPPVLLVVGDGPQRAAIESRVRNLGVEEHVVLTGHLSRPELVGDAIRSADLLLLLSNAEGLPQVLVQAAAHGTPFVAFDVEGVREVLSLGAAGTAVPLGDVRGVVDAVTAQLSRPDWLPREPVADLTSWSPDSVRSAYRAVFHNVLSQRGALATSGPVLTPRP